MFAQSHSSLDQRLSAAIETRDAAKFALTASDRRLRELKRLGQELKAEVEILETNEIAADAFRTLCSSENCQFFRRPEESYGRRLLYLKDQLKDFQASFQMLDAEVERLRTDFEEKDLEVARLLQTKKDAVALTPQGNLVSVIDNATKRLTDANLRLEQLDRASKEQERLEALIDRALKAEAEVNELRPSGGGSSNQSRIVDARLELERSFTGWLATLATKNLPSSIRFDESLRLHLGEERFTENSSYSGSTRTRIVLAYHAALVETSAKLGGCHPRFLILDTPKQHELHAADLAEFVRRFCQMSDAENVRTQLVIGATEQDFVSSGLNGETWRPTFTTPEGPRFFGRIRRRQGP